MHNDEQLQNVKIVNEQIKFTFLLNNIGNNVVALQSP
jgi:hypothetical protein